MFMILSFGLKGLKEVADSPAADKHRVLHPCRSDHDSLVLKAEDACEDCPTAGRVAAKARATFWQQQQAWYPSMFRV